MDRLHQLRHLRPVPIRGCGQLLCANTPLCSHHGSKFLAFLGIPVCAQSRCVLAGPVSAKQATGQEALQIISICIAMGFDPTCALGNTGRQKKQECGILQQISPNCNMHLCPQA